MAQSSIFLVCGNEQTTFCLAHLSIFISGVLKKLLGLLVEIICKRLQAPDAMSINAQTRFGFSGESVLGPRTV